MDDRQAATQLFSQNGEGCKVRCDRWQQCKASIGRLTWGHSQAYWRCSALVALVGRQKIDEAIGGIVTSQPGRSGILSLPSFTRPRWHIVRAQKLISLSGASLMKSSTFQRSHFLSFFNNKIVQQRIWAATERQPVCAYHKSNWNWKLNFKNGDAGLYAKWEKKMLSLRGANESQTRLASLRCI